MILMFFKLQSITAVVLYYFVLPLTLTYKA